MIKIENNKIEMVGSVNQFVAEWAYITTELIEIIAKKTNREKAEIISSLFIAAEEAILEKGWGDETASKDDKE